MRKRLFVSLAGGVVIFVTTFVVVVGPWPTYEAGDDLPASLSNALERIRAQDTQNAPPSRFAAGWAKRSITPPSGTPLAGYGARKGAASTGSASDLYVQAVSVSDGSDRAVIVAADLLIVPENVADAVRAGVKERRNLPPRALLFTATHTHSGPGACVPGLASKMTGGGPFDQDVFDSIVTAFVDAVDEAVANEAPSTFSFGSLAAPGQIRNRARPEQPVDDQLAYAHLKHVDGGGVFLVRYSAHATVLGPSNTLFSADYPGYLVHYIEENTGGACVFVGGAVGGMGPRTSEDPDPFNRARFMGETLGEQVLADLRNATTVTEAVDVASAAVPFDAPPFQIRLTPSWRVSPLLPRLVGIDKDGWIGAVKLGPVVMAGTPCDFSGEISLTLREWAAARDVHLWVQSFNGDYLGYISPDYCYNLVDEEGGLGYETGLMSWCGPRQEAFFTALIEELVGTLTDNP